MAKGSVLVNAGAALWRAGAAATRRHALSVFDLSLQGALLAMLLLEAMTYLLLRRGAAADSGIAFLEDYIVMMGGGVEFLVSVAVSWAGRRRRQHALALSFTTTALAALLLFAFPFNDKHLQPSHELCSGQPISLSEYKVDDKTEVDNKNDPNFVPRTIVLLVTAILCAISKLCIWVHGLTYLDDHQPQNGPFYYGILISLRLSLGAGATRWLRAASLSAAWGRWWLALAVAPLVFSAVFAAFPAALHRPAPPPARAPQLKDSLVRVLKNKFVMLLTIAMALLQPALLSITQYDAAYIQGRFYMETIHQSPMTSRATDIFRPLVILFFIMIFRVRFSVRRADGVKAGTAARVGGVGSLVAAALCAALAAVSCATERRAELRPVCSQHCACAAGRRHFSPVCGLDTLETFFSPCDAGCDHYEDLNGFIVFHNCSCGIQRGVRGSCSLGDCNVVYSVYQVLQTVLTAVAGSGLLMQGMAVLRSVKPSDKTLALGVSFGIIALFNDVLGRLLYMVVSWSCCAVWSEGACLLYEAVIWRVPVVSATLAALSAAISIAASRLTTAIS